MSVCSREKKKQEKKYIWKLALQTKIFLPNGQDMLEVFTSHAYHLLRNLGKLKEGTMLKQLGIQKKLNIFSEKMQKRYRIQPRMEGLAITLLTFIKCLCCARHCFKCFTCINPFNSYNNLAHPANFINSLKQLLFQTLKVVQRQVNIKKQDKNKKNFF